MFSIAVGTASTERVPSRVFLLPSLNSGHLGNGAVEGGTQGVLDPSSVFISGEWAYFVLPARRDCHGAEAEACKDGRGHAAKDGKHLAEDGSEACFPAEAIQLG